MNEQCKQCAELRAINNQLQAELSASKKFAQECEDEAVDLRRQLCSVLKDLAKVRQNSKLVDPQSKGCLESEAHHNSSSPSSKKITSIVGTDLRKPVNSRREGLRSSSTVKHTAKTDMSNGDDFRCTGSPLKRKADVQTDFNLELSDSVSKRPKTEEDFVERTFTLEETVDCLKDLSTSWKERVEAVRRIGDICSGSDKDSMTPAIFEKIFGVFSVQVSFEHVNL